MIAPNHPLPISTQAKLLNISRGTVYYLPKPTSSKDLAIMRQLDGLHLQHPTMGSRMLRDQLNRQGFKVGRRHVTTLMKKMGIVPLSCQKNTSAIRSRSGNHPPLAVIPVELFQGDTVARFYFDRRRERQLAGLCCQAITAVGKLV